MTTTQAPTAKPDTAPAHPEQTGGHDWCPACEGELVQSGGHWHHIMGERGTCTWTD